MPQILYAVAAKVGTILMAMGVSGKTAMIVAQFIVKYGVQVLLVASSIAYSAAQQRKMRKALNAAMKGTGAIDQGRSMLVNDPVASRCFIYGQVPVGGSLAFFHQDSTATYHYMVIVLADRECEELGEIRIDNVVETFDGSGNATGAYAGFLQIRKFRGLAAGERDTVWESEISTKWTANHLGKNQARLHVRLKWDADKFPNGIPAITCMVKGAKVYDPREAAEYASLAISDLNDGLVVTAQTIGADGNDITIAFEDPVTDNEPLAVAVVGDAITVTLATDGVGAITSTASDVKAAIEASGPADALVSVALAPDGDGSGVVTAFAAANLTGGLDGHEIDDVSTWEWSANSALCAGDWLMNQRLGKGVDLARIRDAEWQEAANICDETIVLASFVTAGSFVTGTTYSIKAVGSTDFTAIGASANTIGVVFTATGAGSGTGTAYNTEPRYECHGVAHAEQDPGETLLEMLGSMAGHACDTGGQWTIRAGAWRAPTVTFTDSDIISPVRWVSRQSRQDTYNGVRGTYISPLNDWAPADFPSIKNDTYMALDGGKRLWKDVAYNFTTSAAMAQRLAKIDLEVGRQQIVCTADFMLKALQVQPGDTLSLTRSRLGWSAKAFEVDRWSFKIDDADTDHPSPAIAMTLRETAEAVWDWNDGEETEVDVAPNTNLFDVRTVETVTGLTASTSNFVQADGTISPRAKLVWDAPDSRYILSGGFVIVEYKKAADSTWLEWSSSLRASVTEEYITDVVAGVSYDFRVSFRSVNGVTGTADTDLAYTIVLDTTAPATPTGLTATPGPGCNVLDWAKNTETDLGGYQLFRATTNSFPGGTPLWTGLAQQTADFGVTLGTTYYYWLKAIDRTGNASSQTTSVNSAPLDTTGPAGPALTYSLTIDWHPSGLGGGSINGTPYTGTSTTVTGLNPGAWVDIVADATVSGDNWVSWGGADTAQLESSTSTNSNRILMGGNLSLVANY